MKKKSALVKKRSTKVSKKASDSVKIKNRESDKEREDFAFLVDSFSVLRPCIDVPSGLII